MQGIQMRGGVEVGVDMFKYGATGPICIFLIYFMIPNLFVS